MIVSTCATDADGPVRVAHLVSVIGVRGHHRGDGGLVLGGIDGIRGSYDRGVVGIGHGDSEGLGKGETAGISALDADAVAVPWSQSRPGWLTSVHCRQW